jgi:hypothetical protein
MIYRKNLRAKPTLDLRKIHTRINKVPLIANQPAFGFFRGDPGIQEELPPPRIDHLAYLELYFRPPRKGTPNIQAFQIGGRLLVGFDEFERTAALVEEFRKNLSGALSTYVDIPPGVVLVGDAAEVRAIFLRPAWIDTVEPKTGVPFSRQIFSICVVLALRGTRQYRFSDWVFDNVEITNRRPVESLELENQIERPTFAEMLASADRSMDDLKVGVETIAMYVLDRSKNKIMAVAHPIPYLAADHDNRTRGRNAKTAKQYSLFRIQQLTPTAAAEQINGRIGNQGGTWRLTRRILVKEHKRNQPYGPKKDGATKEILIRAHPRGPEDALPLHPMVRVAQN